MPEQVITSPGEQPPDSVPREIADGAGHGHAAPVCKGWQVLPLALGALGVVYGDIGTSPLYAIKECFRAEYGIPPTHDNVLGILSLVFWSLTAVVSIKYLVFVLRADNQGEGGILALMSLAVPKDRRVDSTCTARGIIIALGLFGAALLGADGIITPAISVLSAVEGLEVATPQMSTFVVPITLIILVSLFVMQKRGTERIGSVFGPAMLVWFSSIALLGLPWVMRRSEVLWALNPYYAMHFFLTNGKAGFIILGAVVLCITGAEALYADLGHFGRRPIRYAWMIVVFPALLLNYFGQGAAILDQGMEAAKNPFFFLATGWMYYPMIVIATFATIIASQALISGAFSLAQQAVQLGYCPRLTIEHTSKEARGQIYVPEINALLMVACCGLVVAFRGSSELAAAYGISVMGTMTITSVLLFVVSYKRWQWPLWAAGGLTAASLTFDLTFLLSNASKIEHGGWFPLVVAQIVFIIMTTWKRGRQMLNKALLEASLPLDKFMDSLSAREKPIRVKGTAVFMTSNPLGTPVVLMHHFKHNKVLHEHVILLCVGTEEVPEVPAERRVQVRDLGQGFYQVLAHYGFMQKPTVRDIFHQCEGQGLKVAPREASFYLGRETLILTRRRGMAHWRKALFAFLSRNALSATAYFGIPPNRVVELGTQVEL